MSNLAAASFVLHPVFCVFVATLLGLASLKDIAARSIPDMVSLGLLAIGVAVRVSHGDQRGALIASATVFVATALCWRCGWLGGGDVKLLTACAWLVPPSLVPQLVLMTAAAGGCLACLYLTLSRLPRMKPARILAWRSQSIAGRVWRVEWWRIRRRSSLPYGCAIAVATLLTLFGG